MRQTRPLPLRCAVLAAGLLALSACGSPEDAQLEQRLQRAEAAAQKAEAAQAAAERAAHQAVAFSQHGGVTPRSDDDPVPEQPQTVPEGAGDAPDPEAAHN